MTLGAARLDAISGGALEAVPGSRALVEGFVVSQPSHSRGLTRLVVRSDAGRLMVQSPDPADGVETGSGIRAAGKLTPAPGWLAGQLRRQGVSMVLHAARIDPTGTSRGGPAGWVDRMRRRGEEALGRGMPEREAALARGFVLGQDDSIDEATTEDFQRSGLAHLLAVSGQNVVLLGLLMVPLLALTGLGVRARLLAIGLVIALYVPLAGGGASIQRAGAMGIAGLLAAAASRPASRLYGLLLAVVATLAFNPLASTDIGWQLSFAAVAGIYLLAAPLSRRLRGNGADGGGWRGPAADVAAVTIAATLATAPLTAFHFGRIPVATLIANLLAAPAVAPAMWLGMIAAAVGQIEPVLALPFNIVNSVLLAYVAEVAHVFGSPGWAVFEVEVDGVATLAALYLALASLTSLALWFTRRGGRAGPGRIPVTMVVVAVAILTVLVLGGGGRRELNPPPPGGARIEVLDVGQGDAILLRPDAVDPVLVDGGPPGGDIEGALDSAGVDDLSAVLLTHEHLDHFGGIFDVLGRYDPDRLLYDQAPPDLLSAARSAGTVPVRISQGDTIGFGDLEMEILWPPADAAAVTDDDPNSHSIVGLLEWRRFRMLLTGDAEAGMAPLDPGPLDVLKVAHHGSDDTGLPGLLARTSPRLAVIAVGEGNSYGHPDASTLDDLEAAGSRILRTDEDGTVSIVLGDGPPRVETGR